MRKCVKCDKEMLPGIALENTVGECVPDFPGITSYSRGQTMSYDGRAVIIKALKCPGCGFSISG